jgi:hypothetical protein
MRWVGRGRPWPQPAQMLPPNPGLAAKFSYLMNCLRYVRVISPVGPFRCLATITSSTLSSWAPSDRSPFRPRQAGGGFVSAPARRRK